MTKAIAEARFQSTPQTGRNGANTGGASPGELALISPQHGRAKLEELGWKIEERTNHLLARLEHRQILLFYDGRVVFKDPTIRARYQLDAQWLKVTTAVWPDVQI